MWIRPLDNCIRQYLLPSWIPHYAHIAKPLYELLNTGEYSNGKTNTQSEGNVGSGTIFKKRHILGRDAHLLDWRYESNWVTNQEGEDDVKVYCFFTSSSYLLFYLGGHRSLDNHKLVTSWRDWASTHNSCSKGAWNCPRTLLQHLGTSPLVVVALRSWWFTQLPFTRSSI